jgi:hypothetical protein
MPLADLSTEGTVFLLRLALVGVLYLFLVSVFLLVRGELRRQAQPSAPTPGRLVLLAAGGSSLPPGHTLPLSTITTLGRAPGSTLLLNDNFVSATHAVLAWHDGQWWLRDAGSTNGTFVNEEPVSQEEVPVSYGDVVGIGRLRLRLAP